VYVFPDPLSYISPFVLDLHDIIFLNMFNCKTVTILSYNELLFRNNRIRREGNAIGSIYIFFFILN